MFRKTTLDNGLCLVTSSMPHTRSVSISIFIHAGSRHETDSQAGISHFIEHLCFRGTTRRHTASDISTAIEGVGGVLNGGTDKELTVYWCKVAASHFGTSFDVLSDMLLNSRFDATDIEKERQVIIEEINMCNDVPAQRVGLLIDELLWPEHPLGRDIAGSRETVSAITRNTMLDYLAGHYQPDNTVIAIAGGLNQREMLDTVNRCLGSWDNRQPHPGYADYVPQEPPRRVKIETRDIEQVNLCLALPGLPYLHPKRFQMDILNVILGEGMSSRLFTEIRDKLGLVYGINSFTDHFHDTGSLIISAGMELKNLKTAVTAIVEQLDKLKKPVPEAELTKAKEYSKGRLLLRMEDSRSVAGWMGGQAILTGRILTVDQVLAIIDAITVEELQELAAELLVGDRLRLALVGPAGPDESLESLLAL